MELHEAIRELVAAHGTSIFSDAAGFRGVLDDVLTEDQATTGDINLLVDAVRFDALTPLVAMIDGGADPERAVEEAGLRLARDRGGDDHAASSWASAVLGYAVGKVPEAVVRRHRSQRAPGTALPPPVAPPPTAAPPAPPVQSPPAAWSPYGNQPTLAPGPGSVPQAPSYPSPTGSYPTPSGYPSPAGFASAPPRKRSPVVWVAAAVAAIVVLGGGITAVVLASGGDDDPGGKASKTSDGPTTPEVDVDPAAIDSRYNSLSSAVTTGASECTAASPGTGQAEVIDCVVNAGELRLVTYVDADALVAARSARLDYRAGTLSADNDSTALYEFDPERGGSSDPAIVYWDSKAALQSATITGEGSAGIDTLTTLYEATSPRVAEPTNPAHPVLREFIDINMDVSGCTRQRTFFKGETEESKCESGTDGIVVNVGRYETRKGLRDDRKYYKGQYDKGSQQGGGGTWKFGEGAPEGAYYAYLDSEGETATLYWDWNKSDCHCYGVAWSFDGDLAKLEKWWPSE